MDCLAGMGQSFAGQSEAEAFYYEQRDKDLNELKELGAAHPTLALDKSPESLLRIEQFYFECFVNKKAPAPVTKERLEELVTQYTRQVFATHNIATWTVFENEFSPGRYDIGLDFGGGGTNQQFGADLGEKDGSEGGRYLYELFMAYKPGS